MILYFFNFKELCNPVKIIMSLYSSKWIQRCFSSKKKKVIKEQNPAKMLTPVINKSLAPNSWENLTLNLYHRKSNK